MCFIGRRWRPEAPIAVPPAVRERYAPDYYAAFVLDPDGHNIEAVCRRA
jgi:hypothetical protein